MYTQYTVSKFTYTFLIATITNTHTTSSLVILCPHEHSVKNNYETKTNLTPLTQHYLNIKIYITSQIKNK